MSEVGPRRAFRIMGIVAIIGGICYGVLQKLWLSKVAAKHAAKNKEEGKKKRSRIGKVINPNCDKDL